jgi:hypothetical protein
MCDTFACGVFTWLDMRPTKDRDNAVLHVDTVLMIATVADTGLLFSLLTHNEESVDRLCRRS